MSHTLLKLLFGANLGKPSACELHKGADLEVRQCFLVLEFCVSAKRKFPDFLLDLGKRAFELEPLSLGNHSHRGHTFFFCDAVELLRHEVIQLAACFNTVRL